MSSSPAETSGSPEINTSATPDSSLQEADENGALDEETKSANPEGNVDKRRIIRVAVRPSSRPPGVKSRGKPNKQGNQSTNTCDSEGDLEVVIRQTKKRPHGDDKEFFFDDLKRPRFDADVYVNPDEVSIDTGKKAFLFK